MSLPIERGKIVLSIGDDESSRLEDYGISHVTHCYFLNLLLRIGGVECHSY